MIDGIAKHIPVYIANEIVEITIAQLVNHIS